MWKCEKRTHTRPCLVQLVLTEEKRTQESVMACQFVCVAVRMCWMAAIFQTKALFLCCASSLLFLVAYFSYAISHFLYFFSLLSFAFRSSFLLLWSFLSFFSLFVLVVFHIYPRSCSFIVASLASNSLPLPRINLPASIWHYLRRCCVHATHELITAKGISIIAKINYAWRIG